MNKFVKLLIKDKEIKKWLAVFTVTFISAVFLWSLDYKESAIAQELEQKIKHLSRAPVLKAKEIRSRALQDRDLTGIVLGKGIPMAIIKNNLLKAGDTIAPNIKVIEIKNNYVVLSDGAEKFNLKLKE